MRFLFFSESKGAAWIVVFERKTQNFRIVIMRPVLFIVLFFVSLIGLEFCEGSDSVKDKEHNLLLDQIIAGLNSTENQLFHNTDGFLVKFSRLPCVDVLKSEYSGGDIPVNWEVARKGKKYYVKRTFVPIGKKKVGDIAISTEPLVKVLQDGCLLSWDLRTNRCSIEKFTEGYEINMAYEWSYFELLGVHVIKYAVNDNKGDYESLRKKEKIQGYEFLNVLDLPDSLVRHRDHYIVKNELINIEGHDCYVLEWEQRDILFVDPDMNFSVRKRIVYNQDNGQIEYVATNKDFKEVCPGLWLPYKQMVDVYANTSVEPRSNWGKIASQRFFEIKEVKVGDIEDSLFEISPPVGTRVVDGIRSIHYTISDPGSDPFAGPIGQAIKANHSVIIRTILIIVGSVLIFFAVWLKLLAKGR